MQLKRFDPATGTSTKRSACVIRVSVQAGCEFQEVSLVHEIDDLVEVFEPVNPPVGFEISHGMSSETKHLKHYDAGEVLRSLLEQRPGGNKLASAIDALLFGPPRLEMLTWQCRRCGLLGLGRLQ